MRAGRSSQHLGALPLMGMAFSRRPAEAGHEKLNPCALRGAGSLACQVFGLTGRFTSQDREIRTGIGIWS